MKRLLCGAVLLLVCLLQAAPSAAQLLERCTTHSYYVAGRLYWCTTCCSFGHCNTTCF